MKSFYQLILESQAADQAHKMGLKSVGWGKWKDSSGKVTHQTKDGKLVKVRSKEKTSNNEPKNKFDEITQETREKIFYHFSERDPQKINFFGKNKPIFLTTGKNFGNDYNTQEDRKFKPVFIGKVDINKVATEKDLKQIILDIKNKTGIDYYEKVFDEYGQDEESAAADVTRYPEIQRTLKSHGFDAVKYTEPALNYKDPDYDALVIWDSKKLQPISIK